MTMPDDAREPSAAALETARDTMPRVYSARAKWRAEKLFAIALDAFAAQAVAAERAQPTASDPVNLGDDLARAAKFLWVRYYEPDEDNDQTEADLIASDGSCAALAAEFAVIRATAHEAGRREGANEMQERTA